jgi:hypothetical protein
MTREQEKKSNRKEQEKKLRIYLAKIQKQINENANTRGAKS